MSELTLLLIRAGFLIVLWLFVFSALRVVRTDLFADRPPVPVGASRREVRDARRSVARKLVVTDGGLAGTSIGLGGDPVTLGRDNSSTLVLTDDYASNHHARLVPAEGTWLVEDLGSTNGTYLGPDKVTGPTPVPLGVPIRIGKTVLELRR